MVGPRRPAVRYYGGKWRLAPWIISHFPGHECYVEPFGGGGSVLLRKERSPLEVYNDLNGEVVGFFRVLRERPEELLRMLRWTPWSRAEYELSRQPGGDGDELEAARRFYVSCWMGFGGGRGQWCSGWRYQVRAGSLWKSSALSFMELEHLYQVAERMRGVQIECRPAEKVIRRCDAPTTLFYLDPPYVHSARSKWKDVYMHEMDDNDHEGLAKMVRGVKGMVVISGYPSELYADLYEGWGRVETAARTGGGGAITSARRTEVLWLSPRVVEMLEYERECRELPLFVAAGVEVG